MISYLISLFVVGTPKFRGKIRSLKGLIRVFGRRPLKAVYGVQMYAEAGDETSMMSILGYYDDVHTEVQKLEPGMAFLDVGANAGVFSLVAAKLVGEEGIVLAFEPSVRIYTRLLENIRQNQLTRVFPFMAAVGERTGPASFAPGPENHTGLGHLSDEGALEVLQLGGDVLSEIVGSLVGDRNIMIKVDVEGAEEAVLNSLAPILESGKVLSIVVEIDEEMLARAESHPSSIYHLLDRLGYAPELGLANSPHYNEVFRRLPERG